MPQIQCPYCKEIFPSSQNRVTAKKRILGSAAVSGFAGSSIGIAGALGAMAGTLPFAVAGGLLAHQYFKNRFSCPHCNTEFKV